MRGWAIFSIPYSARRSGIDLIGSLESPSPVPLLNAQMLASPVTHLRGGIMPVLGLPSFVEAKHTWPWQESAMADKPPER